MEGRAVRPREVKEVGKIKCGMCGKECELLPLHAAECRIFSHANIKPTKLKRKSGLEMEPDMELEHPIYECVTPLRVCLSQLVKPENWKVVQAMQTHREERTTSRSSKS